MPLFDLKSVKSVEGNANLALQAKEFFINFSEAICDRNGHEPGEKILKSGCYVILEQSILELVKNSIDAGATELHINHIDIESVQDIWSGRVAISVIDNGSGFSTKDLLGQYPIERDSIGMSPKAGDKSKLGGCHIGNLQAAYALSQNGGGLYRENLIDLDSREILGAKLVFISTLEPCNYSILDYQSEFCTSDRKCSKEALQDRSNAAGELINSFGDKLTAMKAARAAREAMTPSPLVQGQGLDSFSRYLANNSFGRDAVSPLPVDRTETPRSISCTTPETSGSYTGIESRSASELSLVQQPVTLFFSGSLRRVPLSTTVVTPQILGSFTQNKI